MTHIVEIIIAVCAFIVITVLISGFFLARSHIRKSMVDNKMIDD